MMIAKPLLVVLCVLGLWDAHAQQASVPAPPDLASLVNPFIGTDRGGDIFPGAVAPFGMMQLSPNLKNNGYYWTDDHMHGFVVNLMSGDGGDNEGQVLMAATTGPVKVDRPSTDFNFDHHHESASAGYYQVLMQPWGINAELTTTTRCGLARFTFPAGKQANILLPISYANTRTLSSQVRFTDPQTLVGSVASESFGGERKGITVYFIMVFSKPFVTRGTWTNAEITDGQLQVKQPDRKTVIGCYGSYPPSNAPQEIEVRIGMSYVDEAGATANLKAEMPNAGFDKYRKLAAEAWDNELRVIEVEGGTLTHNRIFYTALYHALIAPTIYNDADGRYRGFDDQIHTVPAGHQAFYATFSGWDIYRTEIPLLSIIAPRRATDMAQSVVESYKQLGYLDRWLQLNQPTTIMNGNPLTICLVNLWNAGLHGFDIDTAYDAMFKQTLAGDIHSKLNVYQGFEQEKSDGVTLNCDASPSTALEYDLSFATLGHLADALNKSDDARYLFSRSLQYRTMFNPRNGFLQRMDASGAWTPEPDAYTEGNEWIYNWFVPHDIAGLVDLTGGPRAFDKRLDEFFHDNHYDPTNEPDLQAPFLYDYIDRPWKTQSLVAETADHDFTDEPGGLAGGGNDDLGTMSSWYILSQLGFYPVDPGIPDMVVCTPRFRKITIHLADPHPGRQFVIEAPEAAPANVYIQSAVLNTRPLTKPWFPLSEITSGGTWTVHLADKPNQDWGSSPFDRPYSLSTGYTHLPQNPVINTLLPTGQQQPVLWRYSLESPGATWTRLDFDDSAWKEAPSGFGTDDEGVTPRTPWETDDIWMRRTFAWKGDGRAAGLYAYFDRDIEIFINGIPIVKREGWVHRYTLFPIPPASLGALKPTGNVLAIHVRHPGPGRHFADAGIVGLDWPDDEK